MKKNLKNEYRDLFGKIRLIVNEIDPESLEPTQDDVSSFEEYDSEVNSILNFIVHHQEEIKLNNNLLLQGINDIWQDSFGRECRNAEMLTRNLLKILY